MTHRYSRHIAILVGAALVAAMSLGASQSLWGGEREVGLGAGSASRSLSDASRSAAPSPAATGGFPMTGVSLTAALPRVPSGGLQQLSDATIPVAPADADPKVLRALPPIAPESSPAVLEPDRNLTPSSGKMAPASGVGAASHNTGASHDACGPCGGGGGLACECRLRPVHEGWLDNTLVFIAGDGWKNIFDDDDNNNFGFRSGFNMGVRLPGGRAVRGQIGMSYGAYDFHGREELLSRDDPIEQQIFATAGMYKRSSVTCGDKLAWGAVYDLLVADEAGERADQLRLAQLRAYVGYALGEGDEIGVWTATRLLNDYAPAQRVKVNVTDQANLFWHHTWKLGGDTSAYVGWADDPGSVVVGLNGRVPLNHRVALFGNVHYIIPGTTGGDLHPTLPIDDVFAQEAWNVSFGISFYRGGKAVSPNVSGVFGLPLLSVADNGSFSYQARMF